LSKFGVVFAMALGLAIVSSAVVGMQLISAQSGSGGNASTLTNAGGEFGAGVSSNSGGYYSLPSSEAHPSSILGMVFQYFGEGSFALAPGSWIFVGGLWVWRGRMKSRWESLGFDSEVFELFVRMRGGKTRVKLLNSLLIPKDRFQLAQELGLDWKAVDRHIMMLDKFGFVHEQKAYGRVRIYELTSVGKMLLRLFQNLNEEENAAKPIGGIEYQLGD
jgi:hypothetical protein